MKLTINYREHEPGSGLRRVPGHPPGVNVYLKRSYRVFSVRCRMFLSHTPRASYRSLSLWVGDFCLDVFPIYVVPDLCIPSVVFRVSPCSEDVHITLKAIFVNTGVVCSCSLPLLDSAIAAARRRVGFDMGFLHRLLGQSSGEIRLSCMVNGTWAGSNERKASVGQRSDETH